MTERHLGMIGRVGLFLCALLVLATPAAAKKLALVIGNDTYQNVPTLAKPVGDARTMRAALASLGFAVSETENATHRNMTETLAKFADDIAPGDVVFFHFSGYGVTLGAENFLLPVDVPRPRNGKDDVVFRHSLGVTEILATLRAKGAGVVVAVLDACRDNPFIASGVKGIGRPHGLARMDPPRGAFIFYAAEATQSSLERLSDTDTDGSSVFIRVLSKVLQEPDRSLVDVAKETQLRVHDLAAAVGGHEQVPAYYDGILGNFFLASGTSATSGASPGTETDGEAPSIGPLAAAKPPGEIPTVILTVEKGPPVDAPARSTHGDWEIRCDKPASSQKEACVLFQYVNATDRKDVGLTVLALQTADRKARLLRILAPLGLLLPSGLGLKIDDVDLGCAGFVRCMPNGCVAEVMLDDSLVEKLEHGKTALFLIFETPEEAIGIPISLNGFGAGMAELGRQPRG